MDAAVARCEVTDTEVDGLPGVAVAGELDAASCRKLAAALARASRLGVPVVLDLDACTFIDSSELRPSCARSGDQDGRAAAGRLQRQRVRLGRHRGLRTFLDTWGAPWVQGGRRHRQGWCESVGASRSPSHAPTFAPSA
jgi:hypothetical protein